MGVPGFRTRDFTDLCETVPSNSYVVEQKGICTETEKCIVTI